MTKRGARAQTPNSEKVTGDSDERHMDSHFANLLASNWPGTVPFGLLLGEGTSLRPETQCRPMLLFAHSQIPPKKLPGFHQAVICYPAYEYQSLS